MIRRSKVWGIVAVVFALANVAGGVFAVVGGETMHAATHFLLVAATAYFWWRIGPPPDQAQLAVVRQAMQSIDHLQQSVDAIALEVERIGEAQRFETKILTERLEKSSRTKEQ